MKKILLFGAIAVVVGCGAPPAAPLAKSDIAESSKQLAAEADVPLYPGATLPEGKSNIRSTETEARYEIVMVTRDSEKEVADFFKKKLKISQIPNTKSYFGMSASGAMLKIDIAKDGESTRINAVSVIEKRPSTTRSAG